MSKRYHILQARAASVPVITTTVLPAATMGQAGSFQMSATSASASLPISWGVTGALPIGVTFSTSGLLSGTPGSSGTFALQFTATDKNGLQSSKNFVWNVAVSTATVPSAPTIGTATAGDKTASISFTPPTNNGGAAISSYVVTSSPGNLSNTGTASPIAVPNLIDGTVYTFTVRAINSVGQSAASAPSNSVTPVGTNTVPGAPTIGTATAGDATASVTFTPPASNGGSAITGYKVVSTPGNFVGTGTASPISVNGLTDGTAYTFAAFAINAIGTSLASASSNSVTPVNTPSTRTIRVSGGKFIRKNGATVQFFGANFEGLEDQAIQGNTSWGVFGTPSQATYAVLGAWKQTIARTQISMNSFLGISQHVLNSTGDGWTGAIVNADTHGTYKADLAVWIGECQRQGAIPMLSNGGSYPDFTFGGVTGTPLPADEAPMSCQTDQTGWVAVCNWIGTQVAPMTVTLGDGTKWTIDNTNILLDMYNEPNLQRFESIANSYSLLKNGGTISTFSPNGGTTVNQPWVAVGYTSIVSAMRSTGHQGPIGFAGPNWSQNVAAVTSFAPVDPMSPAQLFITRHSYQPSSYPYTNGDVFLACGTDPGFGTSTAINNVSTAIAAGYPCIIGETGGSSGPHCTSGEPAVDRTFSDAQAIGHSVVMWKLFPTTSSTADEDGGGNLLTTALAATMGQGVRWQALCTARTTNL